MPVVRFILCTLLVAVTAPCVAAGPENEPSWVRIYQPTHDAVAKAIGLSADEARGESRREYRLWLEGAGDPDALVVIRETSDVVRGQMFWWWENESGGWQRKIRRLVEREYSCTTPQAAGTVEWCQQVFTVPPQWDDLLRTLQEHGLDTLPDQEPGLGAFGGHSLTVEILTANAVVRYHYNNPDNCPHADCARAAAIMDNVWAMYRANNGARSR